MYVVVSNSHGTIYARTHSPEKAGTLLCMVAQKEMTDGTAYHVEGPIACPTCGHGKPNEAEEPKESITLPAAIEMLNNAVLCMATRLNRDRNLVSLEDVITVLRRLQRLIEAKR